MAVPISETQRAEIDALAIRHGPTRRVEAPIFDDFDDPIHKRDRIGEVCFVVRRPAGTLLLSTKTFYPADAWRLPTGGVAPGERIHDALLREVAEETGLAVTLERFLAHIAYRPKERPHDPPIFHTFVFLLAETGGTLTVADPHEQIAGYREIEIAELPAIAKALRDVPEEDRDGIGGSWRDWGGFRAVVHDVVHDALR